MAGTVWRRCTKDAGRDSRIVRALAGCKHAFLEPDSTQDLSDFSVALSLIPDLDDWSAVEKQAVMEIIRAKTRNDESRYLKTMQRHDRLRAEIIRLGS